jgi:hypothetical protein
VFSLSLNVKGDQQTHKKNNASNYGINLKKIILQSSHHNVHMLLAGRRTHNNKAFFMGSRGLLWDRLWEVKILWVRIMGVTLVKGDTGSNGID